MKTVINLQEKINVMNYVTNQKSKNDNDDDDMIVPHLMITIKEQRNGIIVQIQDVKGMIVTEVLEIANKGCILLPFALHEKSEVCGRKLTLKVNGKEKQRQRKVE